MSDCIKNALLMLDYKNISPKKIDVLINKGANINAFARKTGQNPLIKAVFANRFDIVQLLADKGADLQAKNPNGKTGLDLITAHNNKNRDPKKQLIDMQVFLQSLIDESNTVKADKITHKKGAKNSNPFQKEGR